jgi:DNA (cytosine-5)-methyltransferase 1
MIAPTVGSLFAGIGGFDLGFEREGYEVRWQVEIDEYCQKVLAKHWPHVPRYDDVRDCGLHNLEPVDVITGGFPCQDLSVAGNQEGLDGERSALWWDYHRIISELRPRFAVVENVPNLFNRGIDRVCGSLAEIGYDAEWHVISAADMGAPHLRKRAWLCTWPMAHTSCPLLEERIDIGGEDKRWSHGQPTRPGQTMADSDNQGSQGRLQGGQNTEWQSELGHSGRSSSAHRQPGKDFWATEPELGRVAYGVPDRVDRLKGLGNAIVPQIAQQIARTLKPHFETVLA